MPSIELPDKEVWRCWSSLFAKGRGRMLVASADDKKGFLAIKNGAQDYLTKTRLKPDDLGRVIHNVVEMTMLRPRRGSPVQCSVTRLILKLWSPQYDGIVPFKASQGGSKSQPRPTPGQGHRRHNTRSHKMVLRLRGVQYRRPLSRLQLNERSLPRIVPPVATSNSGYAASPIIRAA